MRYLRENLEVEWASRARHQDVEERSCGGRRSVHADEELRYFPDHGMGSFAKHDLDRGNGFDQNKPKNGKRRTNIEGAMRAEEEDDDGGDEEEDDGGDGASEANQGSKAQRA